MCVCVCMGGGVSGGFGGGGVGGGGLLGGWVGGKRGVRGGREGEGRADMRPWMDRSMDGLIHLMVWAAAGNTRQPSTRTPTPTNTFTRYIKLRSKEHASPPT